MWNKTSTPSCLLYAKTSVTWRNLGSTQEAGSPHLRSSGTIFLCSFRPDENIFPASFSSLFNVQNNGKGLVGEREKKDWFKNGKHSTSFMTISESPTTIFFFFLKKNKLHATDIKDNHDHFLPLTDVNVMCLRRIHPKKLAQRGGNSRHINPTLAAPTTDVGQITLHALQLRRPCRLALH